MSELINKLSNWNHENPGKIDLVSAFAKLDAMYKNDNYRILYKELDSVFMKLFEKGAYDE